MTTLSYSSRYYENLREDSETSAREVVPLVMKLFQPRTVIDVGCGSGTWTRVYKDAGAQVLGIDGYDVKAQQLAVTQNEFERHDLTQTLRLGRRFDVVNCLEVAEHLPESRAAGFVGNLCELGDVVVFSAAVPGQGGTHHINEQWPSYWIRLFAAKGFEATDCFRSHIWTNERVAWWYVQNMFAFIRRERVADFTMAQEWRRELPADLVHPRAYVKATVPQHMSPRMLKEVALALPYFPGKIAAHFRGRKK